MLDDSAEIIAVDDVDKGDAIMSQFELFRGIEGFETEMDVHFDIGFLHHNQVTGVIDLLQSDIIQLSHFESLLLHLPQLVFQDFAVCFRKDELEIELQIAFDDFVDDPESG